MFVAGGRWWDCASLCMPSVCGRASEEAAGIREAEDVDENDEAARNRLQGAAGCLESTGGALGNFVGWMEDEEESWAQDRLKEDRNQAIEVRSQLHGT